MQVFNNQAVCTPMTIVQPGHTPMAIVQSGRTLMAIQEILFEAQQKLPSFRCPLCSISGEDLMENEETRQGIREVCESISQICKRFSPRLGGGKKGGQLRIWRILFQLAIRRLELMKTIEEELAFKVLVLPKITTKTLNGEYH